MIYCFLWLCMFKNVKPKILKCFFVRLLLLQGLVKHQSDINAIQGFSKISVTFVLYP